MGHSESWFTIHRDPLCLNQRDLLYPSEIFLIQMMFLKMHWQLHV